MTHEGPSVSLWGAQLGGLPHQWAQFHLSACHHRSDAASPRLVGTWTQWVSLLPPLVDDKLWALPAYRAVLQYLCRSLLRAPSLRGCMSRPAGVEVAWVPFTVRARAVLGCWGRGMKALKAAGAWDPVGLGCQGGRAAKEGAGA